MKNVLESLAWSLLASGVVLSILFGILLARGDL